MPYFGDVQVTVHEDLLNYDLYTTQHIIYIYAWQFEAFKIILYLIHKTYLTLSEKIVSLAEIPMTGIR